MAGAGHGSGAGHGAGVRAEVAERLLAPCSRVPGRGEWLVLPLLGMRRPESCGLGMFGFGAGRFGHIGGAYSFFSVLVASARDGSGAVVMTAANPGPFPFRLLRAIGREQGWAGMLPGSHATMRSQSQH